MSSSPHLDDTPYAALVAERDALLAELALQQDRLQLALAANSEGLWDWNLVTNEVYFSPRWKALLGYEDHELPNSFPTWANNLHPDDMKSTLAQVEDYIEGRSPAYQVEFRMRSKDGTYRWILARGMLVRDRDGKALRMAGSHADVTDRRLLEEVAAQQREELVQAREEALRAARVKAQFLANMSHEIRTPLNGVLGMAQLLEAMPLPEEATTCVQDILRAGKGLVDIVNDILDLSKIEAGHLQLERVTFSPEREVRDAVALVSPRAKGKGLFIDVHVDPAVPTYGQGDPLRFRQVVLNLLSNAIKFTEQGGVTIRLGSRREGDRRRLQVEVQDSGIGISKEVLPNLFQPFTQADGSTTRRYGGTGLGLAICRELVTLMKGGITVTSEVERGSLFAFHLPLYPLPQDMHPEQGESRATQDLPRAYRPLRVLLAEDNPLNAKVALALLSRLGHEAVHVQDGAQVVDRATRETFDVILMDVHMPVLDGLEATRQLRQAGYGAPVLALTASAMKGDEEICKAAGMTAYLTKPLDLKKLERALLDPTLLPPQKA